MKVKKLEYPAKIILAWAEAIGGNKEIRDWLGKNGYPELYMSVFAIRLKDDARDWLIKNGYPHLMAMISGVEGDEGALMWLNKYGYVLLWHIAKAADGEADSLKYLLNTEKDFAHLALRIKEVKDIIQLDHDDVHKISPE